MKNILKLSLILALLMSMPNLFCAAVGSGGGAGSAGSKSNSAMEAPNYNIILISSDGKKFEIRRWDAENSKFLKTLIEDNEADCRKGNPIKLKKLDILESDVLRGDILENVLKILKIIPANNYGNLYQYLNANNLVDTLNALAYLDIQNNHLKIQLAGVSRNILEDAYRTLRLSAERLIDPEKLKRDQELIKKFEHNRFFDKEATKQILTEAEANAKQTPTTTIEFGLDINF